MYNFVRCRQPLTTALEDDDEEDGKLKSSFALATEPASTTAPERKRGRPKNKECAPAIEVEVVEKGDEVAAKKPKVRFSDKERLMKEM